MKAIVEFDDNGTTWGDIAKVCKEKLSDKRVSMALVDITWGTEEEKKSETQDSKEPAKDPQKPDFSKQPSGNK